MLAEKRQEIILQMLEKKGSVTLQELREYFHASESTVRRDLNALAARETLIKVFGGALRRGDGMENRDVVVSERRELHAQEKERIGRYAAALIGPEDFVFLDAGTTTGAMLPYLTEKSAVFVTNGVSHALRLSEGGFRVILIGGELKASTEAAVGNEACENLKKYNFTIGFFGANGVSPRTGFSTPDVSEAITKKCAAERTGRPYVLCDSSKFSRVSPVSFAGFTDACVITERLPSEEYRQYKNVIYLEEKKE